MRLAMLALGLLGLAGLVVVHYLAARALWVIPIPIPSTARVAVALAVPGFLMWWLARSPDFHDISSPGAALLPVALIGGWVFGMLAPLRQRLRDHALINVDLDYRRSRGDQPLK